MPESSTTVGREVNHDFSTRLLFAQVDVNPARSWQAPNDALFKCLDFVRLDQPFELVRMLARPTQFRLRKSRIEQVIEELDPSTSWNSHYATQRPNLSAVFTRSIERLPSRIPVITRSPRGP